MRVVSLEIVLIYLEQIQLSAEHMVNMLEISFKHHKTLELDLQIAKRNLKDIKRHIELLNGLSFEALPKETHELLQSATREQTSEPIQSPRGVELYEV